MNVCREFLPFVRDNIKASANLLEEKVNKQAMKAGTVPECHCFSSKSQKRKVSTGISYTKNRMRQTVIESINVIVLIMHKERFVNIIFE